jgi:hypothetical protein
LQQKRSQGYDHNKPSGRQPVQLCTHFLEPTDSNFTGQLLLIQTHSETGCNRLTNKHSKGNRPKVFKINNFNDLCKKILIAHGQRIGIYSLHIMRRILSIAAIFALISSSLSPLMAATMCAGTGKVMSCHGGEMDTSCDRHAHHHDATPSDSSPSFSEASMDDNNSKCPMDCCAPSHGQNQAKTAVVVALPLPLVAEHGFGYTSIAFVRVGFSSHTDRGPPSLLS